MNILFKGPYKQLDGWGEASKRYLKALCKTDHNICSEFIQLGRNVDNNFSDEEILLVENKDIGKIDTVIHYSLPNFINPIEYCKNICFFHYETDIPSLATHEILKKMDMVLVSTRHEMDGLLHINQNSKEIRVPVKYGEYSEIKKVNDRDPYIFYFIGEINTRKNLHGLLRAYIAAFTAEDNVKLVIKGNYDEKDFHPFMIHTAQSCRKIGTPNSLPRVEYIGERLSRKQLLNLHANCDCFISLSFGESVCLPLLDALMVGNKAIITAETGMDNFIAHPDIFRVDSFKTPCFCPRPPLQNIYTCDESWREPNISQAMYYMKFLSQKEKVKKIHQITIDNHSEKTIVKKLNEIINLL